MGNQDFLKLRGASLVLRLSCVFVDVKDELIIAHLRGAKPLSGGGGGGGANCALAPFPQKPDYYLSAVETSNCHSLNLLPVVLLPSSVKVEHGTGSCLSKCPRLGVLIRGVPAVLFIDVLVSGGLIGGLQLNIVKGVHYLELFVSVYLWMGKGL